MTLDPIQTMILSATAPALLLANVFFIKRLVDKLDETAKAVAELKETFLTTHAGFDKRITLIEDRMRLNALNNRPDKN